MVTFFAIPNADLTDSGVYPALSSPNPVSSVSKIPPENTAMSYNVAFLLSPKEGDLTQHIFKLLLSLLIIRVPKISLSKSSAIINNGFWILWVYSINGNNYWIFDTFLSTNNKWQF